MKQKISKLKDNILNLIYPKNIKCMFCSNELSSRSKIHACEKCVETLPFIANPCEKCGDNMLDNQQGVCANCKKRNYNFVQAKSVFEYSSSPLNVVHAIKYAGKKYLIEYVVDYLLNIFKDWNIKIDLVTNVPMVELKEKQRGYNQSKLMASLFANKVNIPFEEICAKIVDTPSQTTLSMKDRFENIKDCFNLKPEYKSLIKGKNILIIDDVITTGATANELSKVMLKHGANKCYVLTFAHTKLEQMQFED